MPHAYKRRTPVFDLAYLQSIEADTSRPQEIYFLSPVSASVLTQLAELVLWRRTRWIGDDEDEIVRLSGLIYEELKVPVHIDDLITLIDDVESLLTQIRDLTQAPACCPANLTYFPGPLPQDAGYSYDGPAPATWGDGETVADLDDYRQLLCGAARTYVDYLVGIGSQLDALMLNGALIVATAAGILGLLAGAGLILAVDYALVSGLVTSVIAGWVTDLFGDASADIQANYEDIVCAALSLDGSTLAAAIQAAVSTSAWNLWFQWIDYQSALNVIQTGEFGGSTLPVSRSTDCICLDMSNPSTGRYYAVAIPVAELNPVAYTGQQATATVTELDDGTNVTGYEVSGTTEEQLTSSGGMSSFQPSAFCTQLRGWAFSITEFEMVNGTSPHVWLSGAPTWVDIGNGAGAPTPAVGDKILFGNFAYISDPDVLPWITANYDWFGYRADGISGVNILGIEGGSSGPPYKRDFIFNIHNVYCLADSDAGSNCSERYS